MNPRYARVASRALHRCEYCHAPEMVFNFRFEVEHIVPIAQGGEDDDSNLALACRSCNVHKGDNVQGTDPETEAVGRLFHPRQDEWDGHFVVDAESGKIRGVTPIGRATVACLNVNSDAQLVARRQWIRLGIFP